MTNIKARTIAAWTFLAGALAGAPVASGDELRATRISAGGFHTCAVTSTGIGGVKCWGLNTSGQLGDGTTTLRTRPTDVPGATFQISEVAAGESHTCALAFMVGVGCWGDNSSGQLGDGGTTSRSTISGVSNLSGTVIQLRAGANHTCALQGEGTLKCWGGNASGQLGDGTNVNRTSAVGVLGLSSGVPLFVNGVTSFATGDSFTCAIVGGDGLKCWGGGIGQPNVPTDIPGFTSGVASVAAGSSHACLLTTSGGVKCWGRNNEGQLGNGTLVDASAPTDVPGLESGVTAIAAGYNGSCAISGSHAKCWGSNVYGQAGDGAMNSPRLVPMDVLDLSVGAVSIAIGRGHVCVRTSFGTIHCRGNGLQGQLGDGMMSPSLIPVHVALGGSASQAITVGAVPSHTSRDPDFTISASASSGLPVEAVSLDPFVCGVLGLTVTPRRPGICRIAVNQPGDGTFAPAAQVVRSVLLTDPGTFSVPRLLALSTRLPVIGSSDNVGIGGFVIGGSAPKDVIIRARGPSLAAGGVPNPLPNPTLTLFDATGRIARSLDWATPELQGTAAIDALASMGVAPPDRAESAMIVKLQPGVYTALVDGAVFGDAGVAIVEFFEADDAASTFSGISTRGQVGTANDVMIAGFAIQGHGPLTVLVRGRGPSLAAAGVAGALQNPTLELVRASDGVTIATNDDWGTASNAAQMSANGVAPTDSRESAILVTLDPGVYTAILRGAGNTTGIGIVEVFAQ